MLTAVEKIMFYIFSKAAVVLKLTLLPDVLSEKKRCGNQVGMALKPLPEEHPSVGGLIHYCL